MVGITPYEWPYRVAGVITLPIGVISPHVSLGKVFPPCSSVCGKCFCCLQGPIAKIQPPQKNQFAFLWLINQNPFPHNVPPHK